MMTLFKIPPTSFCIQRHLNLIRKYSLSNYPNRSVVLTSNFITSELFKTTLELKINHRLISTSSRFCQIKQAKSIISEENQEILDETKPYVVYDGLLTKQMRNVKLFSITTSAMGISMQPMIINNSSVNLAATVIALGMVGFFSYVTPILIHLLCKKYVTEIIYDPEKDTYTAATYNFFLRRNEITFHKNDVIVPDAPGPFTSVLVDTKDGKKKPLFFTLESFRYPIHYGLIMGYDKPIDLHLTVEDVEDALKKKQTKSDSKEKKQS